MTRTKELEDTLRDLIREFEALRASGDAGFWEWSKDSPLVRGCRLLGMEVPAGRESSK